MEKYESGEVSFPCIKFTEPGVYHFTISEITASGGGWETDPSEYTAVVTVTDEDGELVAKVEYPRGFPEFTNEYKPKEVCVSLKAKKIAVGAPLKKGQFEFGVYDKDSKLVAKATNEAPDDE